MFWVRFEFIGGLGGTSYMQVFLYKFVEHNIYCSNNFRFTERLQSASYLFKGYAIYINKNDEVTHIQSLFLGGT